MADRLTTVRDLGHGISMIDLMQSGKPGRTASYVIRGKDKMAIIEVGCSLDIPFLLDGLKQLEISSEQIDYVIVSHIHLDHAGGVGYVLPSMPNATVVVHPRGARHLIDPSRLISGARAVYGELMETYFGQILPVPEERVLIRHDGQTLSLGEERVLTFYDTPGHARHHFSIWDPVSQGIFSGDSVGIRYVPEITGVDDEIVYPSTSPSEFDREAAVATIDRLSGLQPKRIYHTHFGMTEPAELALERTRQGVIGFDDATRAAFYPGMPWEELADVLRDYLRKDMKQQGYPIPESWQGFELDIELNAKGILYILEKEAKEKGSAV